MDFQQDPPLNTAGGPTKNDWPAIAAELRQHRGEWAPVRHSDGRGVVDSSGRYIREGMLVAFRPVGAFDAKTRINPDGGYDLWASYIG